MFSTCSSEGTREVSLAHVGLKEMKETGPSLPTKSCSDSLDRAELSQSARNVLLGRGEGKGPSVPWASDACKKGLLLPPLDHTTWCRNSRCS